MQQKLTLSAFRSHEQYNPDVMLNDIALLTHQDFSLNDYIKPILLPPSRSDEWLWGFKAFFAVQI